MACELMARTLERLRERLLAMDVPLADLETSVAELRSTGADVRRADRVERLGSPACRAGDSRRHCNYDEESSQCLTR